MSLYCILSYRYQGVSYRSAFSLDFAEQKSLRDWLKGKLFYYCCENTIRSGSSVTKMLTVVTEGVIRAEDP